MKRAELPQTSAQEIGWFTKIYHSAACSDITPSFIEDKTSETERQKSNKAVTNFKRDPRVNYPKRYSEISRYIDIYWSYYPPPIAKFHPKDN